MSANSNRSTIGRKHRKWLGNHRGSALILTTVLIVVLFAVTMIVVDGTILLTSRTQLQNAADAAALAGASGLLRGGQTEATARAIGFASYNEAVLQAMAPVIINADDVSFPDPWVVRVRTHRTASTGDALHTYFRRVIDPSASNTADISAVAAARAFDVCGSRCLKPWVIPDRFDDTNGNGLYDSGEPYDPDGTGYNAPVDVGVQITLKVGNPQQAIEPGIFFPVDYPPIDKYPGVKPLTGGDWYRTFISECSPYVVEQGDRLQLEPGNMVGPTKAGMRILIDLDPTAYWDFATRTVKGSDYGLSPRIALVPFFDPTLPPTSGRNEVTVTKIGAFFMEQISANGDVTGRFMSVTTQGVPCEGSATGAGGPSFLKGIVLVE